MLSISIWKTLMIGVVVIGGLAGAAFVLANSGPLSDDAVPAFTEHDDPASGAIPTPTARPTPTTPPTPTLPDLDEIDGVPIQVLQRGAMLPTREYALIGYVRDCFACGDVVGEIERVYETLDGTLAHDVLLTDVLYPGALPDLRPSVATFKVQICDEGDCNDPYAPQDSILVSTLESQDSGVTFEVVEQSHPIDRTLRSEHVTTGGSKDSSLLLPTGVRITVDDNGKSLVGDNGKTYYSLSVPALSIALAQRIPGSDALYMLLADQRGQDYLYQAILTREQEQSYKVTWAAVARPQSTSEPELHLPFGVSQFVGSHYAVMVEEIGIGTRPVLTDLTSGIVHALAAVEPLGFAVVPVLVVDGPVAHVSTEGSCAPLFAEPIVSGSMLGCVSDGELLSLAGPGSASTGEWVAVRGPAGEAWIQREYIR